MRDKVYFSKEIEGKKVIAHYFDIIEFCEGEEEGTVKSGIKTLQEAFDYAVECIKNNEELQKSEDKSIWHWTYGIELNEETHDCIYTTMFKVYKYKGVYHIKEMD